MKFLFALGVWTACVLNVAAADDGGSLVEKMGEAYGGRAALEKLGTVRESGTVQAAMRMGSSGPVMRLFARPLQLRVEVGTNEVRLVDGPKGWRNGKEVKGMQYEAMVLQAVRLDLPWQLLTHKDKLVEKEPRELDGKRLRVVELPLENGLSVSAGIEPDTGHILWSSSDSAGGAMGGMNFETHYDDFRKVDGVLFAFKEVNFANGTKTAETTLGKIELLKSSPEGAFEPQPPKAP
jgi:hypothetical protein